MAIVIVVVILYLGYLHCVGSVCVLPLICADSKAVTNIYANFPLILNSSQVAFNKNEWLTDNRTSVTNIGIHEN